jgi:HprK-related kinase A
MRHRLDLKIGPVSFRIGSAWRAPVDSLRQLYDLYPAADPICDFTVRLEPERPWRRWLRPSVAIHGDFMLPDAAPLALAHGLLAAEMGMNLQMALGQKNYLLLHAATVEKDGRALIMTGESGAGKSTLAALLGERGWRLMGDEFALLDPVDLSLHPFPRAISLKNEAIGLFAGADESRLGPRLDGTPKGSIRHLRPRPEAILRMEEAARPALILFPQFGMDLEPAIRPVGQAEVFVRQTHASTKYVALGEAAYKALNYLVSIPSRAIDYPDTESAVALVEQLWAELA